MGRTRVGGTSTPYRFPGRPSDEEARALYDERTRRGQASFRRGREIFERGRELPESAYDLGRMRRESSNELRAVAEAIEIAHDTPDQVAEQLRRIEQLLGNVDDERVRRLRQQLRRAAGGASRRGAAMDEALLLTGLAQELQNTADAIEGARTHAERERVHSSLLPTAREDVVSVVASSSTLSDRFGVAVLLVLDRLIQVTAVTYTGRQRAVLEGREHVLADPALRQLIVSTITPPSLAGRSPEVRSLLELSREIISHPYEQGTDAWWRMIVKSFILTNGRQLTEEIHARNLGQLLFREPGETMGRRSH